VRQKLGVILVCVVLVASVSVLAKGKAKTDSKTDEDTALLSVGTFKGLSLRGIGPSISSGRISDLAVDPANPSHYFVAASSGGVWKTVNSGTTWTPVFDDQGSYSIGVVTLDPNDPTVVWVGTGENNSQRSVSYGDGVYRSLDGGSSWEHMGLKESEHIGSIVVDPRDSNVVYVAAQGPLWRAGGERGLYKTTDKGSTWELILEISEDTGINEVVMDPRNPDVLYASAYQRRRHVWTLLNGGPEGAIHKSSDAGKTWTKLAGDLPDGDVGRIGMAISPADPRVIYAIIEAAGDDGGFFRSVDGGASWDKRSDYVAGSPQYYNELVADPKNVDRVYSMDTYMQVTEDGGKTWHGINETTKHVDNHALWINPEDTNYLLSGNDGGVYESYDRGDYWHYKANLPLAQFYRGTTDNDYPFYNVYGGTQDNATIGGPARTGSDNGITNRDWFITVFGDGFKTRIDPENPDIVYSQWQYGGLARFDKKSGEVLDIQPQPAQDAAPNRWNWDSPLIISPHSHTRLYYASQRIYRSDDRGADWQAISEDLTRQLDRNKLKIMGKVWSVDAVAKNRSTSFYGNIVALAESPLAEGLLYAGTDDGLIQITEDGGQTWRKQDSFPGVPELAYVAYIIASEHDADTVYAAFDHHKHGDFTPYVLKSTDRGVSWQSIAANLPERGSALALAQDHVNADLLFCGTEFGLYFTADGGVSWTQLDGGMPVVAVRDLDIQRRETDLLVTSFGRGFYILDDYSALRNISEEGLEQAAILFDVKDALAYNVSSQPLGIRGAGFQGDSYYVAPNPPFGAVFTYYLKEGLKSRKDIRKEAEKEAIEAGEDVFYPSWDELKAEDREEDPVVMLTVEDGDGHLLRRITGPTGSGFHRVNWDLRYPAVDPTNLHPSTEMAPWDSIPEGPMTVPGTYQVTLSKKVDGELSLLAGPVTFKTVPLGLASISTDDRKALLAFQQKTAKLQRAVLGAVRVASETSNRLDHLKQAVMDTPAAGAEMAERVRDLEMQLADLRVVLTGDRVVSSRAEPTSPSIRGRVNQIVYGHWANSAAPTGTHLKNYTIAAELFKPLLADLRQLVEVDLNTLEDELEAAGAPWTPGRFPTWE
jgi:photosystem II stability/assembly factor-like uncharacterized protein